MKGASSSLGADRIADYFQLLEKKGSDQNLDGADELMEEIKLTFAEMKGEIEKY
jgi:HPt (histidine-containing phosphotransfer) domain-containing protein